MNSNYYIEVYPNSAARVYKVPAMSRGDAMMKACRISKSPEVSDAYVIHECEEDIVAMYADGIDSLKED
jgi:hypothetical protein